MFYSFGTLVCIRNFLSGAGYQSPMIMGLIEVVVRVGYPYTYPVILDFTVYFGRRH